MAFGDLLDDKRTFEPTITTEKQPSFFSGLLSDIKRRTSTPPEMPLPVNFEKLPVDQQTDWLKARDRSATNLLVSKTMVDRIREIAPEAVAAVENFKVSKPLITDLNPFNFGPRIPISSVELPDWIPFKNEPIVKDIMSGKPIDIPVGKFVTNLFDQVPEAKRIKKKVESGQILTDEERRLALEYQMQEMLILVMNVSFGRTSGRTSAESTRVMREPIGPIQEGIIEGEQKALAKPKLTSKAQPLFDLPAAIREGVEKKIQSLLPQVDKGIVGTPFSRILENKQLEEQMGKGLLAEVIKPSLKIPIEEPPIKSYAKQEAQALYDDLNREMQKATPEEQGIIQNEIGQIQQSANQFNVQLKAPEPDLMTGVVQRGDITKLETELNSLIGYEGTGAHWKQEYYIRQALLDEAKAEAPPEVATRIEAVENRLYDIRESKLSMEKKINDIQIDQNVKDKIKAVDEVVEETKKAITKKVKEIKEIPIDKKYIETARANLQQAINRISDDEFIRRQDISRDLSEKLDALLKQGGVVRGAKGHYEPKPETIHVKGYIDLSTVSHEIGHHIENLVENGIYRGIRGADVRSAVYKGNFDLNAYRSELLPIAPKPRGTQKVGAKLSEGLAEFISKYVTNPNEVLDVAPRFYQKFEEFLSAENPALLKALQDSRIGYETWKRMPASRKVLSQLSSGDGAGVKPRKSVRDIISDAYTFGINNFYPVEVLEREAIGAKNFEEVRKMILEKKLRPEDVPSLWYKRYRGSSMIATRKWIQARYQPILESIKDIADEFRVYIMSKRILDRSEIQFGISPDIAQEALDELAKNTGNFSRLEIAGQKYQEYTQSLLQELVDSGVLSNEGMKKITDANQFYAPAKRVMDDVEVFTGISTKQVSMKGTPIKTIKGSLREIIDPLEQTMADTYRIVEAAERNRVARAISDLPQLAERMDLEKKAKREVYRSVEEVKKKPVPVAEVSIEEVANEFGIDLTSLPSDLEGAKKVIFRVMKTAPEKGLLGVFKDGELKFYRLPPQVAQAVTGANEEQLMLIARAVQPFTQMLKTTATGVNPEFFLIRNPLRDQITAGFQSRFGYVPFYDGARVAFNMVFGRDKYQYWYNKFIDEGGSFSYFVTSGREGTQQVLQDILKRKIDYKSLDGEAVKDILKQVVSSEKPLLKKITDVVTSPLQLLEKTSMMTENMTRVAAKRRAVETLQKLGIEDPYGLLSNYESREVSTDFGRKGAKMMNLNQIYAYINARTQGLDNVARTFKERPARSSAYLLLFALMPTVGLYLWNRQFSSYFDVKSYEKDNYFVFMFDNNPEHAIRIPKPDFIKMVTIPLENALMWMDNKNPDTISSMAKRWYEQITPMQPSELAGTFGKPILEQLSNYNFFYNRQLIPESLKNSPVTEQYNQGTSEAAKILSKMLDSTGMEIAPIIIDNYFQSYFAGTGRQILQIGDLVFKKDDSFIEKQKGRIPYPIFGSFLGVNLSTPFDIVDELQTKRVQFFNEIMFGSIDKAEQIAKEMNWQPTTAEVKSAVKSEMIRQIRKGETSKAEKLSKEFGVGLTQKELTEALMPENRAYQALPKSLRTPFLEKLMEGGTP